MLGPGGILGVLRSQHFAMLTESIHALGAAAEAWHGKPFEDDIAILALEMTCQPAAQIPPLFTARR